jgi:hypothetical protein
MLAELKERGSVGNLAGVQYKIACLSFSRPQRFFFLVSQTLAVL